MKYIAFENNTNKGIAICEDSEFDAAFEWLCEESQVLEFFDTLKEALVFSPQPSEILRYLGSLEVELPAFLRDYSDYIKEDNFLSNIIDDEFTYDSDNEVYILLSYSDIISTILETVEGAVLIHSSENGAGVFVDSLFIYFDKCGAIRQFHNSIDFINAFEKEYKSWFIANEKHLKQCEIDFNAIQNKLNKAKNPAEANSFKTSFQKHKEWLNKANKEFDIFSKIIL